MFYNLNKNNYICFYLCCNLIVKVFNYIQINYLGGYRSYTDNANDESVNNQKFNSMRLEFPELYGNIVLTT